MLVSVAIKVEIGVGGKEVFMGTIIMGGIGVSVGSGLRVGRISVGVIFVGG